WLRMAMGERPIKAPAEYEQILNMRNLLHICAGRKQDVLSRQRQAEIADALDQDVYAMMAEVARAGLRLSSEYEQARGRILESRFALNSGVQAARGEAKISAQATGSEAAIGVA